MGVVRVPHVGLGVNVSARLDEVVDDARVAVVRGLVEGGVSPLERERAHCSARHPRAKTYGGR